MKYFFLCCCLLLQIVTKAQLLYSYKDTVHRYSIGIPEKWKYWTKSDSSTLIKLLVYDMDQDSTKRIPDNFNITIIDQPAINIDSAFYRLAYFTAHSRLQMLDTGSYIVDKKKMLWFDDVHIGENLKDTFCASDFVVYNDDKVYLITCTTNPLRFSKSRELFHRIAQTFKVALPPKHESLKIDFPTDRTWMILGETNDSTMHFMQVMPTDENAEHWTTVINFVTTKNPIKQSIQKTLETYKANLKEEYKDARFTLLSKGDDWGLFKTESIRPTPEASLYYVLQTSSSLHTVSLTVPHSTLSADISKKWTDIFLKRKLVVE
jgi:hypothetical protein